MAKWYLLKEVQTCPLNLGIHDKPQVVKLNVNLDSYVTNAIEVLKDYVKTS